MRIFVSPFRDLGILRPRNAEGPQLATVHGVSDNEILTGLGCLLV